MQQPYTLKKSLGQHFLKDDHVCMKIVSALSQRPIERLLEVGPGGGALTQHLLKLKNLDFKAVELDEEKIIFLQNAFPQLQGKLIHQSILDLPVPFDKAFTVVGNFPYNISSQILFKILEWRAFVPVVIGMFQKEVAQRVAAESGSKVYGILSVLVQTFYSVEYLFDVSPGSFLPPPKVMSGVIRLTAKKDIAAMQSEKLFFSLVKMAFNQRRKMLRNAVKSLFPEDTLQEPIFTNRAEQLTIEDFAQLTFKMKHT